MKKKHAIALEIFRSGKYSCTKDGRVFSHAHRHGTRREPKELRPQLSRKGYPQVVLCREGRASLYRVHTLIYLFFKGPYDAGLQINHINGIKTDNRIENLETATCGENVRHSIAMGLRKNSNNQHSKGRIRSIK